MYDRYEVRENHCNCHPEDCSCDDWAIFKNGEKWANIFDKGKAEHMVRALNIVEQLEESRGEHFHFSHVDEYKRAMSQISSYATAAYVEGKKRS